MTTIPKCLSALIASGNGDRCQEFIRRVQNVLLCEEESLNLPKVLVFKAGRKKFPDQIKGISREIIKEIQSLFDDVDAIFFEDKRKMDKSQLN